MITEDWCSPPGYNGRYLVTRSGKIRSTVEDERLRISIINGASIVRLLKNGRKRGVRLEELVEETFATPSRPVKSEIFQPSLTVDVPMKDDDRDKYYFTYKDRGRPRGEQSLFLFGKSE